jgi:hypothetical protein
LNACVKKAETLDMLQKGQLTVHTDYAFEEKEEETVSRLTRYAVRGLLVAALMLGSALLCIVTGRWWRNIQQYIRFLRTSFINVLPPQWLFC